MVLFALPVSAFATPFMVTFSSCKSSVLPSLKSKSEAMFSKYARLNVSLPISPSGFTFKKQPFSFSVSALVISTSRIINLSTIPRSTVYTVSALSVLFSFISSPSISSVPIFGVFTNGSSVS